MRKQYDDFKQKKLEYIKEQDKKVNEKHKSSINGNKYRVINDYYANDSENEDVEIERCLYYE